MGWFIAGIIAAPILWFVFKVVAGAAIPLEVSGRQVLKQELGKLRIDASTIPEACLDEFVQSAKKGVELLQGRDGFSRTKFLENLLGEAKIISMCLEPESWGRQIPKTLDLDGATDFSGKTVPVYAYRRLMKHGVVPPLPESSEHGA